MLNMVVSSVAGQRLLSNQRRFSYTVSYLLVVVGVILLESASMAFTVPDVPSRKPLKPVDIAHSRRSFLSKSSFLTSLVIASPTNALFGNDTTEKRQKELCLVNILRLQYWAQSIGMKLDQGTTREIEERKKAYLEARLGAKAIVAKKQKIGGGASPRVFALVGLQITDCLGDLKFYAKDRKMDELKEDLTESLASLVEFDGLETTQDPSPTSSLTLGQYNDEKATFVRRTLLERIVPLTQEIVDYFGPDSKAIAASYIRDYYSNEIPPVEPEKVVTPSSDVAAPSMASET